MKILIATPLFPPDIGGPATYSKLLLDGLPKRGILTKIIHFGEVRRLPKGFSHLAYFFLTLWRARECDAIYAQDPVSVGFPALLAARFLRKRFFLKVVGDFAWEQWQIKDSSSTVSNTIESLEEFQNKNFDWKTNLRKKTERFVAIRAEKIIVPSKYLKKIVMLWGIPAKKIVVIYNAFEPIALPESKEEIKRKLGLSSSVILTAGRLVPWKGIDALLKIMPDILVSRPDAKLVIIGEGTEENLLHELAQMPPPRNAFFAGRLTKENLCKYIKAADVFVLNSSYEGFSHQLLEVMSIGTPIVASNAGGNPELISDGENGFLVEYNDTLKLKERILALLAISDVSRKFSETGKKTAENFSKEKMLEETSSLFI